ncbi:MAG TPA: cytochrome b N-terminal domain-containing protein [Acidobacteriota bacterium]|jgi:ubiquinol-cytochrome c reductase cytochrome b subunit
MLRQFRDWFVSRTGVDQLWNHWMREKIPARTNWFYTLGSLALFLFAVQLITGIVLAFYYAPTPQAAYASIQYLQSQVLLGRLIRALHHWGASFMVVIVFLHMGRVFVYGSFKRPREVTWMTGVVLLLVVLAFGFTGYLLPWDQKAYWGTVVGTNIAGLAPGLGKHVKVLLRGGDQVGALTLSRFYAIHVILLPGLIIGFIAVHLSLMRRHGITAPPGHESDTERREFYPEHAVRDAIMMTLVMAALLVVASLRPAPLESPADLNASGVEPKPDWYFLALYQLLKYFPGPAEVIGAVVIPTLLFLLLLALPFLDRRDERRISARKPFAYAGTLLVLALVVLTFLGGRSGRTQSFQGGIPEMSGAFFFSQKCASCHALSKIQSVPDDTWIQQHAREKHMALAASQKLTARVANSLAAFLRSRPQLDLNPTELRGAGLFVLNSCVGCHTLAGSGGMTGPNLNRIGSKRDKSWLIEHFKDPEKLVPGSKMPAFDYLPEGDLAALSDFLLRFR